MAYWFTGFFAQPRMVVPDKLLPGVLWKEITSPFLGVGVRLSKQDDENLPETVEVEAIARQLGFNTADAWIFLVYVCWAGRIDFIYGLGQHRGAKFGPGTPGRGGLSVGPRRRPGPRRQGCPSDA
jgi:hypothetical protein